MANRHDFEMLLKHDEDERLVDGTCPDCEKPSAYGERCADCRAAFDQDCEALNADLRDEPEAADA